MTVVAVLVKHVPIGSATLLLDVDGLRRDGVAHGLDPLNEVGLEWALQQREAGLVDKVLAVTMASTDAVDTLRRSLAIGVDEAVLVTDPRLAGADVRQTAHALAGAVATLAADIAVFGYESADGSSGVVPAAVAALLARSLVSRVRDVRLVDSVVRATRDLGNGPEQVEADLPVVISFVEGEITPRFPKVKDVIRTKSADVRVLSAADVLVPETPPRGERVIQMRATPLPAKEPEVVAADAALDRVLQLIAEVAD